MTTFERSVDLPVSADEAFAWHERKGAFERLTPPWEAVRVLRRAGGIRDGGEVEIRVRALGPLGFRALYRHSGYEAGRRFCDTQVRGPFRRWHHEHRFEPAGEAACRLTDHVEYAPPFGGGPFVRPRLEQMFAYRHAVTRADLAADRTAGAVGPRTVLLSGASGLIGRALHARLTTRGHTVRTLSRSSGDVTWSPSEGRLDPRALDGVDAVVHLAGEPIAQRWTDSARERILDSRVSGTRLLAEAAAESDGDPPAFISASGVNYYGSTRREALDEGADTGEGFLAEVCRRWEDASQPVEDAGGRRVLVRTGIVLSPAGGALAKLLPPFRLGLGGPVGDGRQRMSCISLDDVVEIYLRAVESDAWSGPLNAVAPETLTNRRFSRTLGSVLRRPAVLPVPRPAVVAAFGQMGRETLLADLEVVPRRLTELGFEWRHATLEPALRHLLGRRRIDER